jgi:hypothetical protein
MFWGEPYCQQCQFVGPELIWMWHRGIGLGVLLRNNLTHALRVVEVADHPAFYRQPDQTDEVRANVAKEYVDSILAASLGENEERIDSSCFRKWEFENHGETDLTCPCCGRFLKWRGTGVS